jgi:hypothetical protein
MDELDGALWVCCRKCQFRVCFFVHATEALVPLLHLRGVGTRHWNRVKNT